MTTIDTEEEWDWTGPFPETAPSVENIYSLPAFQDLCERFGMRSTYFANLAVLQDPMARQVMKGLARRDGVEVGMHVHPWHTPPLDHEAGSPCRASFLHNSPAHIIRAKLDNVYTAFLNAGITPVSFRGGRYSTGGEIQRFLQDHGFVADCSVVPYTSWPDEGAPDYRQRNLFPVRLPAPTTDLKPLWELPLTLGFSRQPFHVWSRCFNLVEGSVLKKFRLIGVAERLKLVRRIWLNLESDDPCNWAPFLRLLQKLGLPYVCLTVHSSSLTAGPGPYARTRADADKIVERFKLAFSIISTLPGFVPATAGEIAQILEERTCES